MFYFDWITRVMIPAGLLVGLLSGSVCVGVIVGMSMPVLTFLQGLVFFINRRVSYGHFPEPVCPSHGLTIVKDTKYNSSDDHKLNNESLLKQATKERPLRMILISDSSGIGIGQNKTTTPIMPEVMARTLSRRMGGRPVYWTCFGKTGMTTGYFVRELDKKQKESAGLFKKDDSMDTASTSSTSSSDDGSDWDEPAAGPWRERLSLHASRFDTTHSLDCYDIAVVTAGTNDVKDILFPFLTADNHFDLQRVREKNKNADISGETGALVEFLRSRMGRGRATRSNNDDLDPPLIALVGLPTRATVVALNYPSCYLGVPAFDLMDKARRSLVKGYSDVVFLEPITKDDIDDYFDHKGKHWEGKRREETLLNLVQAKHSECRRVARDMEEFFSKPTVTTTYRLSLMEKICCKLFGWRYRHLRFFAADGMHANEIGLDCAGRVIAEAVYDEWQKRCT